MALRVLYVITDLALGGTPRALETLVTRLDRGHIEPAVITLLAPSPITQTLAARGIEVHALDLRHKLDLLRLARLPGLIRAFRPDVLHGFLFHANILVRLLGRACGVRAIVTSERGIERAKGPIRVLADRWTHRLSTAITANSQAVRQALMARDGIPGDRIRVIPNGVDTNWFRPGDAPASAVSGRAPTIALVARLVELKGHLDLVAALPALKARVGAVRVVIAGEGPLRKRIIDEARLAGVADAIELVGPVLDVRTVLAGADIFCLPSHEEGMPGSVLEAQAMGLPVVATRVGGTPEIVGDGTTGLLVPPHDPPALAGALARLCGDVSCRATMGQAARARAVEHFSVDTFVQAYVCLYEDLIRAD